MNSEALAGAVARFDERSQAREDEVAARLKLPPLLEQRRRQFSIPEEAFREEALYDRILVWQPKLGDTYSGSNILMDIRVKARKEDEAPQGVIITAGLSALDVLWSHGIEVGHMVSFCNLAPYRRPLDDRDANALVILRDGDLISSEDVRDLVKSGVLRVEQHEVASGGGCFRKQHVYFDTRTNSIRVPWAPVIDNQL
jgi:hypothetical protein